MELDKRLNIICDFDGTLVDGESLNLYYDSVLGDDDPKKLKKIEEFEEITSSGMNHGKPFCESLRRRIELLIREKARSYHIEEVIRSLRKSISKSFLANRDFIRAHREQFYVISGGFREIILPLLEDFLIPREHVRGNTFVFDGEGYLTGFDENNVLAQNKGKVAAVSQLNLEPYYTYVIGDGYTDYEIKSHHKACKFFAYTENVFHPKAVEAADYVIKSFDEFLDILETHFYGR